MFILRPYQHEATAALHTHLCTKDTNPCVVVPTGGGKSVIMAAMIKQWSESAPHIRGIVLAHRKELVEQNAEKFKEAYGETDREIGIGIFAAGLGQKDYYSSVTFASIDSVYRRFGDFPPFDFIFVDEAHRIPTSGEGKYRTFIAGCRRWSPDLRVVGWTATPFRMGCGPICHRDHILNEVCYEAKVEDLIAQGYLSDLRSKVGISQPDLSGVKRNSGGDYIVSSLSEATNTGDIVSHAVAEAVRIMAAEKRKSAVFFCVDIEHCNKVSKELARHGIYAPVVTSKTPQRERDRLVRDFRSKKIKAICNVSVFTEGFDAPHIDTVVLLRPTLSAGLYAQMVGRGFRQSPGKDYCLVLDFANCIDEHGPIDLLGSELRVVMATCGKCRESFSRASKCCPACGWEIPKQEVIRLEKVESERRMHGNKASKKNILSSEPETYRVDSVHVSRWIKDGSPDSVRVQYRCGLSMFREWVCLDHPGYAGSKAQSWYAMHVEKPKQHVTVNDAIGDMFLAQKIHESTKTITVKKNGKFFEIIAYNKPATE